MNNHLIIDEWNKYNHGGALDLSFGCFFGLEK